MSRRIGFAALIWAVGIFLSRIIGLVREAVFGRVVGGGSDADVYWAAFTLPDFLNYLLAAGALSIVFIPIFGGHFARGDEDEAWGAFSSISTFVVGLLIVVTGVGWFVVPSFNAWWFAGFDADAQVQLNALTRIVLPAQIFHVLGGMLSAALQARDRHTLPAMAPLIYTGSIIAGGLVGVYLGDTGAWGFAWGVLVGSVLGPFALPLIGCLRMGMRWRPRFDWSDDLRDYLWRSLPIMLAFSIVMWDDWILKGESASMAEGSLSTLTYAKTLMKVPMGVFGLALGAAAFPTLTRLMAEGKRGEAYETLAKSLKRMLVLALAAQVGLTAAGPEVAEVVYGSRLLPGQHAAIGTAVGLMCLGLWAWASQTVVARGFYAMGRTWLPSLLGSAVVLVAYPIYWYFGQTWGTAGLAGASAIAISLYVLVLGVALRRVVPEGRDGYLGYALRMSMPLALGLGVGVMIRWVDIQHLVHLPSPLGALIQGGVYGCVAITVFAGATLLFRVREVTEVVGIIRRKVLRR
ncbi:MAG: putative peptidoglycan lipid II flippase [Kiritimatiellia bacterium]|jgi:putative peptidoglycan lipid II flippase